MFPKIQESIDILGGIQAVVGLELKKDETPEALVERLSQPLWVLGLTDAMTEMRGYLSDPAGTKQPPELFAKIQKAVYTRLFSEVYRNLRDLRYDLAALELTPPSPEVKAKLDTALGTMLVSMFGQDKGSEFLWNVLRLTKVLGPLLSKYDFKTHAEAPKKALEELRIAMKEDLRRTLSLGRQ